jgi:hypothetical protein
VKQALRSTSAKSASAPIANAAFGGGKLESFGDVE